MVRRRTLRPTGRNQHGYYRLWIAALSPNGTAKFHWNGLAGSHHPGTRSGAYPIGLGSLRARGAHGLAYASPRTDTFCDVGQGRVQTWGGPVREIRAGDTVWIPPGEKHWHGATAEHALEHIAMQEAQGGEHVTWLEPVTDAQYSGKS